MPTGVYDRTKAKPRRGRPPKTRPADGDTESAPPRRGRKPRATAQGGVIDAAIATLRKDIAETEALIAALERRRG